MSLVIIFSAGTIVPLEGVNMAIYDVGHLLSIGANTVQKYLTIVNVGKTIANFYRKNISKNGATTASNAFIWGQRVPQVPVNVVKNVAGWSTIRLMTNWRL